MIDYRHYVYRVIWSEEDKEYVGLCAEFPSLSYLDEDDTQAYIGIKKLVKEVVADMEANGEKVPEPVSEKTYSGKFQIRTTPEVHRKLAIEAAEQNVSLNRYVNSKLVSY